MGIVEQIEFRDIRGVRVGRYGRKVNTTSFLWRSGSTLIDTGPPNQWPVVRDFASSQSTSEAVVTHHHEDHAGNLARLPGLGVDKLYAPAESLDLIADGFPLQAYRRVVWGRPGRVRARPLPERFETADGATLEALLLPGHSPDMTCLLDSDRGVLFSADLYIGSHLRYLRIDENLSGIITSLERALTYDFDTLLCSHRGVVQPAKTKLRAKLDSLYELREQARSLAAEGLPLRSIVSRLLGNEDFISAVSRGHFSKRNLIAACLTRDGSTARRD